MTDANDTPASPALTGREKQLFDRDAARRIVTDAATGPVRRFLDAHHKLLVEALAIRATGYSRAHFKEEPTSLGLCFHADESPVVFWFGAAWEPEDEDGGEPELPSWGTCLRIQGPHVAPFMRNEGQLMRACARVAAETPSIDLNHLEGRVELAEWRPFRWLLKKVNQRLALEQFWFRYLDLITAWGVTERLPGFTAAIRDEAGTA
jgi:hypothetical protein